MGKQLVLCVVVILKVACSAFAVAGSSNVMKKEGYGGEDDGSSSGCPLGTNIYQNSCPEAEAIIFFWVHKAVFEDSRMAASLLRLHFHDCFGCDGSVLLDDREGFVGEKSAAPNLNSLRGFEVIDAIKSELEFVCPQTVSCADILAIAARDSVVLSGGPSWEVQMGRRDSLNASKEAANNNIPSPNSTVDVLLSKFQNVGLTLTDMVALSGAHTIGRARCTTLRSRLEGSGTDNVEFLSWLQQLCSGREKSQELAELDVVTPATFDNQYYVNLLSGEGLLLSDHTLVNGDQQTRAIVQSYAEQPLLFFRDFKDSMIRMGSLLGMGSLQVQGQIRTNCRTPNN